jgi:hypothetical protein
MKAIMAEREKQSGFWTNGETNNDKNAPEYSPRQCDLNARNNASNVVRTQQVKATAMAATAAASTTISNSSSQQMRFWN